VVCYQNREMAEKGWQLHTKEKIVNFKFLPNILISYVTKLLTAVKISLF